MLKKICIALCCIMATFSVVECSVLKYDPGSEFDLNMVTVVIKAEYYEAFNNQTLTIEDFEWDNIERFGNNDWGIIGSEVSIPSKIYLKEPGREQVLNAIEHFETLDFIESASMRLRYKLDEILVGIKSNYQIKFENEQFTIDSFRWNNIERIVYGSSYIKICLKESGREQLKDAIERFNRLKFVEYAEVNGIGYLD